MVSRAFLTAPSIVACALLASALACGRDSSSDSHGPTVDIQPDSEWNKHPTPAAPGSQPPPPMNPSMDPRMPDPPQRDPMPPPDHPPDPGTPDPPPQMPSDPDPQPPPSMPVYGSMYYAGVPGEGVSWLNWPAQTTRTSASWGPVLTDIVNHLPASYGNEYYDADKVTWAHETSHGISSHLRIYRNTTGHRANAFYVDDNKAAIIVEPNIRKSQVAQFVPRVLQGSRYATYITGQTAWDDTPLYVFDEWNAYTNGGATGVDLESRSLWTQGWRDAVAGPLEFTVYALATAIAVERFDPQYFATNTQFREFVAFEAQRAMEIYRRGAAMPDFMWTRQDAYYRSLQTAPEAEPIRAFARRLFGTAWADRFVLGLAGSP